MAYSTANMQSLIDASLGDEELRTFCLDFFPSVYRQFTAGQSKDTRVRMLVEYALHRGRLDELLDRVRQANPDMYAEFKPRLETGVSVSTSAVRRWLAFALVLLLLIGSELSMSTFLEDSKPGAYLCYWRGYPWFPAIVFAVGLVSLFAVAESSLPLRQWADDDAVPLAIRFILKILTVVDSELLPRSVWWFLVVSAVASIIGLNFFPQCVSSNGILVSFRISRGDIVIGAISRGETIIIEPGITVRLQAQIAPLSQEMKLPILECLWSDGGIGSDGKLLQTKGCTVDYENGQDEILNPVSMKLTQQHCPSLEPYPFFVGREP